MISQAKDPFSIQDFYYGKKQVSPTNYFDYRMYALSSDKDSKGVSIIICLNNCRTSWAKSKFTQWA
ncbi:MAG: hypothetical protein ACK521_01360 [bacterium]